MPGPYRISAFTAVGSLIGASLLSIAAGAAIALVCLALGLLIRGWLEAFAWAARLVR